MSADQRLTPHVPGHRVATDEGWRNITRRGDSGRLSVRATGIAFTRKSRQDVEDTLPAEKTTMKMHMINLLLITLVGGCSSKDATPVSHRDLDSHRKFERVSMRMYRSDVEAILGAATHKRAWTYPTNSSKSYPLNRPLYTEAHYGTPPSVPADSQMGLSGKIGVLYDEEDRVLQKDFYHADTNGMYKDIETDSVLGHAISVFQKLDWSTSSHKRD